MEHDLHGLPALPRRRIFIVDRDGIHKLDIFSRKSLFSREKIGVNKEDDLENKCIGPELDRLLSWV